MTGASEEEALAAPAAGGRSAALAPGAWLLRCGMRRSGYGLAATAADPGRQMAALLDQLYLSPDADVDAWVLEPVRLCAALVTEDLLSSATGGLPGLPKSTAGAVVDRFTASSGGDPLFGAHVSLLLSPLVSADIRAATWKQLLEDRCLALLPEPGMAPAQALAVGSVPLGPGAHPRDLELADSCCEALLQGSLDRCLSSKGLALPYAARVAVRYCMQPQLVPRCLPGGGLAPGSPPEALRRFARLGNLARECSPGVWALLVETARAQLPPEVVRGWLESVGS